MAEEASQTSNESFSFVQTEHSVLAFWKEKNIFSKSLEQTASGQPYDKNALSAAHRTLAFGTRVRVTYLKTGQSVEVVINDRGPHAKGRIIDLSGAAAKQLGLIDAGHGKVRLEIIEP